MELFDNKQVLVTGGAGFIGSHLVDRLIESNATVTVIDSLITGSRKNLQQHHGNPRLTIIEADVSNPVDQYLPNQAFDLIFHLASPASPKDFSSIPIPIYMVNSLGTHYLCQFAVKHKCRLVYTSTSEAYGDPLEHPQKESYFGNVNPIGPRACYDESKRFGEMVVSNAVRHESLDGRIVRIFNTYGPRMNSNDGRVIPSFINQCLNKQPITIHGDGLQTRSFCYVDDLVELILRAMVNDNIAGEVFNIGNPDEYTMLDIAKTVKQITQSNSEFIHLPLPQDDPVRRKPDMTKTSQKFGNVSYLPLHLGLKKTIEYFTNN